jgi:hypothetical protein
MRGKIFRGKKMSDSLSTVAASGIGLNDRVPMGYQNSPYFTQVQSTASWMPASVCALSAGRNVSCTAVKTMRVMSHGRVEAQGQDEM